MEWKTSTGMWNHVPSRTPSSSRAMLLFPELDVPLSRMTVPPAFVSGIRA